MAVINKEVVDILKEYKIPKDEGLLCLLGIYFKLDVEKTCPEEVVKAINMTKIVDKDHKTSQIIWNIPLFEGQITEWDWVVKYNDMWKRNPSRKASNPDCIKRMKEWFAKYPQYRKQDVQRATEEYHKWQKDPEFLKNSAAFIFDGSGAMKKSILLQWCEKVAGSAGMDDQRRGQIVK